MNNLERDLIDVADRWPSLPSVTTSGCTSRARAMEVRLRASIAAAPCVNIGHRQHWRQGDDC